MFWHYYWGIISFLTEYPTPVVLCQTNKRLILNHNLLKETKTIICYFASFSLNSVLFSSLDIKKTSRWKYGLYNWLLIAVGNDIWPRGRYQRLRAQHWKSDTYQCHPNMKILGRRYLFPSSKMFRLHFFSITSKQASVFDNEITKNVTNSMLLEAF